VSDEYHIYFDPKLNEEPKRLSVSVKVAPEEDVCSYILAASLYFHKSTRATIQLNPTNYFSLS